MTDTAKHLNISIVYAAQIRQIVSELSSRVGLDYFGYNRFYGQQKWLGIYSDPGPVEADLRAGRGPIFVGKDGIELQDGAYLIAGSKNILKLFSDEEKIDNFLAQERVANGKDIIGNGLLITKKGEHYDESFFYSMSVPQNDMSAFYYRHREFLKYFCLLFLDKAKNILSEAEASKTTYSLNHINKDKPAYEAESANNNLDDHIKGYRFITSLGDVYLSNQEFAVLKLISVGHTLKTCGEELDLSPRTVESYVESVKNKLNCEKRIELIEQFNKFLFKEINI